MTSLVPQFLPKLASKRKEKHTRMISKRRATAQGWRAFSFCFHTSYTEVVFIFEAYKVLLFVALPQSLCILTNN